MKSKKLDDLREKIRKSNYLSDYQANNIMELIDEVEKSETSIDEAWRVISEDESAGTLQSNIDYVKANHYSVNKLPEVPNPVAEWIEEKRKVLTLSAVLDEFNKSHGENPALLKWRQSLKEPNKNDLSNAQRVIARMYLDGYTIEEQVYYVLMPGTNSYLTRTNGEWSFEEALLHEHEGYIGDQRFTKDEIVGLDENYWAFAIPAEEMI